MANNINVTPGSGKTIAAEEITSVLYQQVKLIDATATSTSPTGVAANPLKVDGSAVTQPVSGTVTANMGTVTADPFGANADAASATGSISAKLRFIASTGIPITGTVTVASHAVTNAGTFAVQTTSQVPGTGATNLGKAEDAAHSSGDTGVMALVVRNDTRGALAGTDGDYSPFQVNASGDLRVDGSAVTQPVSGTVTANMGTVTADPFGANADAASATGSISAKLRFIAGTGIAVTNTVLVLEQGTQVQTDDTAFTPGGNKVSIAGFVADEASTDSVDEDDVGAARMTLDRKQIVTVEPHTAGGLSVANFSSEDGSTALTATAQVIKASAGQVYGWYIYNPNASAIWVHLYNVAAASVTVGTTNPLFPLVIPATSAANILSATGITFSNAGFSIAATTTGGGNTAPGTALEAVIFYK